MYARCQDMPGITLDHQAALERLIGDEALAGCVVHVTGEYAGGLRMIDVWTSEEAFHAFQTEHLWPALDRLAAETAAAGRPAPQIGRFTVVEVAGEARWGQASRTPAG
jgi:hypothetical protein